MSTITGRITMLGQLFLAAGGSALIAVIARTEPACEYLLLVALVPLILVCRRSSTAKLLVSSGLFTVSYLLASGSILTTGRGADLLIGPSVLLGTIVACQVLFRVMGRYRSGFLLGLLLWAPVQYLLSECEPTSGLFDLLARTPGLFYRVSSLFGVLIAVLSVLIVNWLVAETVLLVFGRDCARAGDSVPRLRAIPLPHRYIPRRSARYVTPPHRAPPTV